MLSPDSLAYKAHLKYTRGSHASTTCGWQIPVSPQLYHARSVLCTHPRALLVCEDPKTHCYEGMRKACHLTCSLFRVQGYGKAW